MKLENHKDIRCNSKTQVNNNPTQYTKTCMPTRTLTEKCIQCL